MTAFKQYLTELPQQISNLGTSEVGAVSKLCRSAMNDKSATSMKQLDSTSALYHFSTKQNAGVYFLGTLPNTVEYFVKYEPVKLHITTLPHESGIRQVLIARLPEASPFAAGIGADIFWNILFAKHKCLISDSQQTSAGRAFWEYRIKEALERQHTVRMINTNDNTFVDITSMAQLKSINSQIWGPSRWFQRIVLAIY